MPSFCPVGRSEELVPDRTVTFFLLKVFLSIQSNFQVHHYPLHFPQTMYLRTRPRYWWDKSVWKNFTTIGLSFEELSCKRSDTLTDSIVYSLFEYTKNSLNKTNRNLFRVNLYFLLHRNEWNMLIFYFWRIRFIGHPNSSCGFYNYEKNTLCAFLLIFWYNTGLRVVC
jgi:hypothetical protein